MYNVQLVRAVDNCVVGGVVGSTVKEIADRVREVARRLGVSVLALTVNVVRIG